MDDDVVLPHQIMANRIKALVSKEKKRYQEGGYDLDLTYINSNIIAMGYPAEKLEGVYRNNIDDVVRFLEEKHADHYRVYNLCAERSYDGTKFHNRVVTFPMEDHNPPRIEMFEPFCLDMDEWLNQHEDNVAVVHCKAGKGRTGVMICAYLLHSKEFVSYEKALTFYGRARTKNHKGVTIPSQRRYVQYFGELKQRGLTYEQVTLLLKSVEFSTTPSFNNNGACTPLFVVNTSSGGATEPVHHHNSHPEKSRGAQGVAFAGDGRVKLFASTVYDLKKGVKPPVMYLTPPLPVCGDIQVEFYNKSKVMKKERLCHFWFNTFFVAHCGNSEFTDEEARNNLEHETIINERKVTAYNDVEHRIRYTIPKCEIDKAVKDSSHKVFSHDFTVTMEFVVPLEDDVARARPPARHRSRHLAPPGHGPGHACVSDSEPEPPSEEEHDSDSSLEWEEHEKLTV